MSDEATVAETIDSRAFSDFCGVDSSNQVPDGDTLGRFRNLLLKNGLQEKLFAQVVAMLMERGLILKKGTIVDSTLIAAPSSTKNKEKQRDPEAHSVKKGNQWYFGYKEHIGVDTDSGYLGAEKKDDAVLVSNEGAYPVSNQQASVAAEESKRRKVRAAQSNRTCEILGSFQSGTCVLRDKENLSFLQDTIPRTGKIASALLHAVCTCEFIPCSQSNEGCVTRFISRTNSALE